MKDEVKEILDYLNIKGKKMIGIKQKELLLDYITNLQEEKKIPEKIPEEIIVGKKQPTHRIKKIEKKINEIISYLDYLKSKGG